MKKILSTLGVFIFLIFLSVGVVSATPEEEAVKHGIVFPIAELGNCTDFNTCRTFCEDPVNQGTCIDFAKKKGFHKEETTERKDEILRSAKEQLGCDSESSCKVFCSQGTNHDKCIAFAQKHNLGGGVTSDPSKGEILNKAKEVLGCSSHESCRTFCENPQNSQKCSEFAKQTGLRGGEQHVGPGGCTSEETCKSFCSDPNNYQICSGFNSSTGRKFSGPGGCNSEASCRTYCQEHPQECGYGGPIASPKYDPIETCSKTPNCAWKDNTCQCGFYGGEFGQQAKDYADFCRQNPEKCGPGQSGGFESSQKRGDFEKFCRENPEKCGGQRQPSTGGSSGGYSTPTGSTPPPGGYNSPPPGGYSTDPATGCAQAGGSWVNGSCQFGGSSGSYLTPSYQTPTGTYTTPSGSYSTPSESYPSPSSYSTPTYGTPSYPTPSQVQGATTQRGFFENLLQLILRSK